MLRACGCVAGAILVAALGAGGSVASITWTTSACTVDNIGASVTMQGWGAQQACSDVNSGLFNVLGDAGNFFHAATRLGPTSGGGATYAVHNCDGWNGNIHYSVAHEGLTQNPIVWATGDARASYWCRHLPKTNAFNLPFRLPGT